jgi:hypothetical protein
MLSKLIRWLIIAVVALWLIQNPAGAAALAHHLAAGVSDAARALSTFTSDL